MTRKGLTRRKTKQPTNSPFKDLNSSRRYNCLCKETKSTLMFTLSWRNKCGIHAFPKVFNAICNANSLNQVSKSGSWAFFPQR